MSAEGWSLESNPLLGCSGGRVFWGNRIANADHVTSGYKLPSCRVPNSVTGSGAVFGARSNDGRLIRACADQPKSVFEAKIETVSDCCPLFDPEPWFRGDGFVDRCLAPVADWQKWKEKHWDHNFLSSKIKGSLLSSVNRTRRSNRIDFPWTLRDSVYASICEPSDRGLAGSYNWVYSGGTLASLTVNGDAVLFRTVGKTAEVIAFNQLSVSESGCIVNVVESHTNDSQSAFDTRAGRIFQLEAAQQQQSYILAARHRSCVSMLNVTTEEISLERRRQLICCEEPISGVALSSVIAGEICISSRRNILLFSEGCESHRLPVKSSSVDEWSSLVYGSHPRTILFVDRHSLTLFDVRCSKTDAERSLFSMTTVGDTISRGEEFSALCLSGHNSNICYLATDHRLISTDIRKPGSIVQCTSHMLRLAPFVCRVAPLHTGERQCSEVVSLCCQGAGNEVAVVVNDWSHKSCASLADGVCDRTIGESNDDVVDSEYVDTYCSVDGIHTGDGRRSEPVMCGPIRCFPGPEQSVSEHVRMSGLSLSPLLVPRLKQSSTGMVTLAGVGLGTGMALLLHNAAGDVFSRVLRVQGDKTGSDRIEKHGSFKSGKQRTHDTLNRSSSPGLDNERTVIVNRWNRWITQATKCLTKRCARSKVTDVENLTPVFKSIFSPSSKVVRSNDCGVSGTTRSDPLQYVKDRVDLEQASSCSNLSAKLMNVWTQEPVECSEEGESSQRPLSGRSSATGSIHTSDRQNRNRSRLDRGSEMSDIFSQSFDPLFTSSQLTSVPCITLDDSVSQSRTDDRSIHTDERPFSQSFYSQESAKRSSAAVDDDDADITVVSQSIQRPAKRARPSARAYNPGF